MHDCRYRVDFDWKKRNESNTNGSLVWSCGLPDVLLLMVFLHVFFLQRNILDMSLELALEHAGIGYGWLAGIDEYKRETKR